MSAENNKTPVTPRDALRRAGAVAFWFLVWQLASMAVGSELLLAGPVAVLVRLSQLVPTPAFWTTVGFSLARIAVGFAVAFALGLALGLAAHRRPALAELLAPAVSFLKSVPIVCVIVLLLMWVGSARVSAIAVFLAVFPAIYFSVLEGRAAANPSLGELLRVMGVPGWRRFLADTWQQLLPYLVATCRNACGMAWKAGVAAELIGSPRGSMGERIYQATSWWWRSRGRARRHSSRSCAQPVAGRSRQACRGLRRCSAGSPRPCPRRRESRLTT